MPVPSFRRLVTAAQNASAVLGCTSGVSGGTCDGAAIGSGSTMCSPVNTDSIPASSAAVATVAINSGAASADVLIGNRPTSMPRLASVPWLVVAVGLWQIVRTPQQLPRGTHMSQNGSSNGSVAVDLDEK